MGFYYHLLCVFSVFLQLAKTFFSRLRSGYRGNKLSASTELVTKHKALCLDVSLLDIKPMLKLPLFEFDVFIPIHTLHLQEVLQSVSL